MSPPTSQGPNLGVRSRRAATNLALISLLSERFPKCFALYAPRRRPLKTGIYHDVLTALDGAIDAKELRGALRWYCSDSFYLVAIANPPGTRFDLDGKPAGAVTPEQRAQARQLIDVIRKQYVDKARAARAAAAAPQPRRRPATKRMSPPAPPAPSAPPRRPSPAPDALQRALADLRASAQRRKNASV
jgi:sRNA-binding protein